MVLTANEIRDIIKNECRLRRSKLEISIPDETYVTVNKIWVAKTFYSWYCNNLIRWGVKNWHKNHDCDNKAGLFKELANVCYASNNKSSKAQSLAIGEFWYKIDNGVYHAINIIISKPYDTVEVNWIEPQNGNLLNLTLSEKKSVLRVRM